MSLDYSSIGGIGIKVNYDIEKAIVSSGLFTDEDIEEDLLSCLESVWHKAEQAGNCYNGELRHYFMVEGSNLGSIKKNTVLLIAAMKEIGIDIKEDDLAVISDLLVY